VTATFQTKAAPLIVNGHDSFLMLRSSESSSRRLRVTGKLQPYPGLCEGAAAWATLFGPAQQMLPSLSPILEKSGMMSIVRIA
jgi:hypothetical protein